jgi:hypothetical protein
MLRCFRCKTSLGWNLVDTLDWTRCPVCGSTFRIVGFPAAFHTASSSSAVISVLAQGESSCFYHPHKRAVLPCESCGRFLCSLCDVELSGQHLCPGCLETGKRKGRLEQLQNHRLRYDKIALGLAVLPVLLIATAWFTIVTAPAAMFVAIRHWKSPSSLLTQSKVRFVVAMLIAGLQLAGWGWLVIVLLRGRA